MVLLDEPTPRLMVSLSRVPCAIVALKPHLPSLVGWECSTREMEKDGRRLREKLIYGAHTSASGVREPTGVFWSIQEYNDFWSLARGPIP